MTKNTIQKNQKTNTKDGQLVLTAKEFLNELLTLQVASEIERAKRFFTDLDTDNRFIGVRMAKLFAAAKKFKDMPPDEIERLLESPFMKRAWVP